MGFLGEKSKMFLRMVLGRFFNLRLCMMKCNLFLLGSRNIYMDMFINFAVQNGDLELSIPYRSRNSLPIGRSWMYNICR